MKLTVKELAERLNVPYEGDGAVLITGVAGLERADTGDLVFCAKPKFMAQLEATKASAVILPPDLKFEGTPVLRAEDPHLAFVRATEIFHRPYRPEPGIHPTAVVSPSAKIGKGVSIGAFSVVGDEAEIGEGTVLFPHVTVYPRVKIGAASVVHSNTALREGVRVGSRVIIHNGVVIGADGFGYLKGQDGAHIKIPQIGTVVIEDDVEIGANTTIDRATLGETIVRRGAKIDDLVMVSHNVEVGENAILIAQVGIAGSSTVGRNTILSGQVGIADHIDVGDNVIVAAKSGVTGRIPSGAFVSGSPHLDIRDWRKFWALAPHLYDIVKDFKKLKARVEELEQKLKQS
jgi:UDP-3-O-[3-hydroxymyristoyl] glucosamine N-acyltransferase